MGLDYALLYGWQMALIFANFTSENTRQYRADYQKFLSDVIDISRRAQRPQLAQALLELPMPHESAEPQAWQSFAEQLLNLMHTQRDIGHEWQLNSAQLDQFSTYLIANELLVQCLKFAYGIDRQAIEATLLLPPNPEA